MSQDALLIRGWVDAELLNALIKLAEGCKVPGPSSTSQCCIFAHSLKVGNRWQWMDFILKHKHTNWCTLTRREYNHNSVTKACFKSTIQGKRRWRGVDTEHKNCTWSQTHQGKKCMTYVHGRRDGCKRCKTCAYAGKRWVQGHKI